MAAQSEPEPLLRRSAMRDRRGRGMRGPLALPGPHSPDGLPLRLDPVTRFDATVAEMIERLEARCGAALSAVEFGVEEAPWVDDEWRPEQVPTATLVRASGSSPARIVVFRLPIRRRATGGHGSLRHLVLDALVERVAELLGRDPDEIDPRIED